MKYTRLGAFAASAAIVLSACSSGSTASESPSASGGGESSAPAASCTVKIATELPMQGSELAASEPIVNGVKLAIKQLGASSGCTIDFPDSAQYDDALNGAHDPQTGALVWKDTGERVEL